MNAAVRFVREWLCSGCWRSVTSICGPPLGWTYREFYGPVWVRCPECGPVDQAVPVEAEA